MTDVLYVMDMIGIIILGISIIIVVLTAQSNTRRLKQRILALELDMSRSYAEMFATRIQLITIRKAVAECPTFHTVHQDTVPTAEEQSKKTSAQEPSTQTAITDVEQERP